MLIDTAITSSSTTAADLPMSFDTMSSKSTRVIFSFLCPWAITFRRNLYDKDFITSVFYMTCKGLIFNNLIEKIPRHYTHNSLATLVTWTLFADIYVPSVSLTESAYFIVPLATINFNIHEGNKYDVGTRLLTIRSKMYDHLNTT